MSNETIGEVQELATRLGMQVQVHPRSDDGINRLIIHTRALLSDGGLVWLRPGWTKSMSGNANDLALAIVNMNGVEELFLDKHHAHILKGVMFEWSEILPKLANEIETERLKREFKSAE